jgi:YVTN family beta-propeller protein
MIKRSMIGLFAALVFLWCSPKARAQTFVDECSVSGLDGPVSVSYLAGTIWAVGFNNNMVSNLKYDSTNNTCSGAGVLVDTGTNPWGLSYDGTNIWVTNYGSDNITVFNATSGSPVATYSSQGTGPKGITYDGTYMWVVNSTSNTVAKILASNGDLAGSFSITSNGWDAAFDGTNVWVTSGGDDTITVINVKTGSVQTITDSGCGPGWEAFDGTHMWVGCYDSKSVRGYTVSNLALYANVGATGHAGVEGIIHVQTDASNIIVGVTWNGSMFYFNIASPPASATWLGQISGGPNCYGLAWFPNTDYFYVASWSQNLLWLIYT